MEITPQELRDVEIAEAFRGYNRDVVNDLLERAAAAVEAADERAHELTERLKATQLEADRSRETEDILHRTLLLAQRAADEAVAEAQQKARATLEEAELESHKLLADAQAEAQRRGEAERERLEDEVIDLAARRDALIADVDVLGRYEREYREKVETALEADLARVRAREPIAPGPMPETRTVEIPAPTERVVRSADASGLAPDAAASPPADPAAETAADTASDPAANAASEPAMDDRAAAAAATAELAAEPATGETTPAEPQFAETQFAEGQFGESQTEPTTEGPMSDEPITADTGATVTAAADSDESTREVDMSALFDADAHAAAPVAATSAGSEPSDNGFAARFQGGPEAALDTKVLDDEAFFASLREAVTDETPLGPRDDQSDETAFFGDESERTTFRDVFRRRR